MHIVGYWFCICQMGYVPCYASGVFCKCAYCHKTLGYHNPKRSEE